MNLRELVDYRGKARREADIESVLEVCNNYGVTLVELEEASKLFVSRYEELQQGIKANRHKVMRHNRAKHAIRTRWARAKAFLTSHIERAEKLEQTFGGVSVELGEEIIETPQPEKKYLDVNDYLNEVL